MTKLLIPTISMVLLVWAPLAFARHHGGGQEAPGTSGDSPECQGDNGPIPVNNAQVLQWKTSTPNQFLGRAHVQGVLTQVYPDETGHNHFEITMGGVSSDTVEIVYDMDFGQLPNLQVGMQVEACGDFINSYAQAGHYAPSPDGAIIHWVHRTNGDGNHAAGYLILDGTLYGQGGGYNN
jgi:hypothetical protein